MHAFMPYDLLAPSVKERVRGGIGKRGEWVGASGQNGCGSGVCNMLGGRLRGWGPPQPLPRWWSVTCHVAMSKVGLSSATIATMRRHVAPEQDRQINRGTVRRVR